MQYPAPTARGALEARSNRGQSGQAGRGPETASPAHRQRLRWVISPSRECEERRIVVAPRGASVMPRQRRQIVKVLCDCEQPGSEETAHTKGARYHVCRGRAHLQPQPGGRAGGPFGGRALRPERQRCQAERGSRRLTCLSVRQHAGDHAGLVGERARKHEVAILDGLVGKHHEALRGVVLRLGVGAQCAVVDAVEVPRCMR